MFYYCMYNYNYFLLYVLYICVFIIVATMYKVIYKTHYEHTQNVWKEFSNREWRHQSWVQDP